MTDYRALDHPFRATSNEPAVATFLDELLRPLREEVPAEPAHGSEVTAYHLAYRLEGEEEMARLSVDDETVYRGRRPDRPLRQFLHELNRRCMTQTAQRRPVLHAAAAKLGDRAIVLPQAPRAGKSTLVARLATGGWGYGTDELVAIDPANLAASGVPRAITLRPDVWSLFHEGWVPTPPELSRFLPDRRFLIPPDCTDEPIDLTHVVLYVYDAHLAEDVDLRPLEPIETLRALLGASFSVGDHPQRDLTTLARLTERVGAWQLRSGSLEAACAALAELPMSGRQSTSRTTAT
jgi:hypothetical protein